MVAELRISCIVPAYERLDQFARCLSSLVTQDAEGLEIIVTDDSRSTHIRDFAHCLAQAGYPVRYVEGPRNGNPVDNWNHGLALARAPYAIVVHQDEFLIDSGFLARAMARLEETGKQAVFGNMAPIAIDRPSRFAKVKRAARALGLKPWTLFVANWIGPIATVVFRRSSDRLFDARLVNTVDVDFYFALLGPDGDPEFIDGVAVSGLGHHEHQISAAIDRERVSLRELDSIIRHRSGMKSWQLNLLIGFTRFRLGLRTFKGDSR